jgi:hypothetical protein
MRVAMDDWFRTLDAATAKLSPKASFISFASLWSRAAASSCIFVTPTGGNFSAPLLRPSTRGSRATASR